MARATAFARQVELITNQIGEMRRQALITLAKESLAAAEAQNRAALGRETPHDTIVDGQKDAREEQVKPGGVIVYLFKVASATLEEATDEAIALVQRLSPVKTGRFRDRMLLLVNGVSRDADVEGGAAIRLQQDDVVSITNLLPYARKLEKGASDQAPNGIFEAAAAVIRSRYGGVVNVRFAYQTYPGQGPLGPASRRNTARQRRNDDRFPTITLSVR